MLVQLTPEEARVIGCLVEKSITTPDQCPLTLNALTNACNQKSAREPVMSLTPSEVQRTARSLKDKAVLQVEENFRTGAEKYKQRLCNTTFSDLKFDAAQYAIICLLLLRGSQTPGELRAHSGRLHSFADNAAMDESLAELANYEPYPLVVKLPRTPGRKESEYMHLLSGPVDVEAHTQQASASAGRGDVGELKRRIQDSGTGSRGGSAFGAVGSPRLSVFLIRLANPFGQGAC